MGISKRRKTKRQKRKRKAKVAGQKVPNNKARVTHISKYFNPLKKRTRVGVNSKGHVTVNGKSVPGIRGLLQKAYWQGYTVPTPTRYDQYPSAKDPMKHGLDVEREAQIFFETGKTPRKIDAKIFCGAVLAQKDWSYVGSQVPVALRGAGTRADFVFYDHEKKTFIVVELKTGCNFGLGVVKGASQTKMFGAEQFSCTRKTQALFQLTWTMQAFSETTGHKHTGYISIINKKKRKDFSEARTMEDFKNVVINKKLKILVQLPKTYCAYAPTMMDVIAKQCALR